MSLAFEKPNLIHLDIDNPVIGSETSVVSAGMVLTTYLKTGWMEGASQYIQREAPDRRTLLDLT